MGGNARAINSRTGEVITFMGREAYAEKIDFRLYYVYLFKNAMCCALEKIQTLFAENEGHHIWLGDKASDLKNCFSGSSKFLFDDFYVKEDLFAIKPVFGDIDLMLPIQNLHHLWNFLPALEGENIYQSNDAAVCYVGQNKQTLPKFNQINAVFEYREVNKPPIFVQVDFEGVEFDPLLKQPTEWSKFAHSSSLIDLKLGFKGVCHKYWLTNLIRAISVNDSLVVLTDKSLLQPSHKINRKVMHGLPRTHAFSISHGLRLKLQPQFIGGKPLIVDGKYAVKELSTAQSRSSTYLNEIFDFVFPLCKGKYQVYKEFFESFSGLLTLCHLLDVEIIDRAFKFLIEENLWGKGAQRLERDSAKVDREIKEKMFNEIVRQFPSLLTASLASEVGHLQEKYYADYVVRNVDKDE